MTRSEAQAALYKGFKITHRYFSDNEFIQIKDGRLVNEKGLYMGSDFWSIRSGGNWEDDWKVFIDEKEVEKPILYIGANHPNVDSIAKEIAKSKDYEVCIVDEVERNFVNYNTQIPDKSIDFLSKVNSRYPNYSYHWNSKEFSKPVNSNKHKNTLIKNKKKRRNKKKRK